MGRLRLRLAVLGAACGALLVIVGCGGSNRSSTATTPTQSGGTVTAAGGTSAGAPSDSTGIPGSGGSPSNASAGGTSGGPSDQGGPGGGTSSGSSGGSSGSTSGGGAPGGSGTGGTPPDACAGLVPTPGAPVEVARDISNFPMCHLPASDGSGTAVALGVGLHHSAFDLYPMTGGASVATISVDYQDTGPVFDALLPSTIGFHGAVGTGPSSTVDRGIFSAYDDHGALLTTSYQGSGSAGLAGDVRLLKVDPAGGGTALMTVSGPLQTEVWNVEIVDAGGHRTAGTALDTVGWDLSVAIDGHVLVTATSSPGSWKARWLDHDTKPLTDWFAFQLTTTPPPYQSYLVLEPLADGSIALREGDGWTLSFPNGVARADPAPAWLASRPATDVAVVRGGKAMALTARSVTNPCGSDSFELVTPTGQSCGKVQLTSAGSCAHAAFGRDGTAFTLSVGPSPTSTSNQLCTYRWWPGLVR